MHDSSAIHCLLCGHFFQPGAIAGFIFCPACGRRFNPHVSGEATVIVANLAADADMRKYADDAPEDASTGSRHFGDYDIIEEIARGGMGVVYLARQRILRRVVALKVLRSGDNASPEERERLLREAKAAAGLTHPNIVPIHEFSIHQGQPYFTMDFIDGAPLDRILENGPLKVRQAVEIIATVAQAIAYAHERGIIHRDLKPGNIILTPDGRPMITDFGLAVEQTAETANLKRMTMAGTTMGTIPYAPPEQAAGKIDQISVRSDVYSMGALLYEMVTGRPPFSGITQFELLRRVINHDPPPPRQLNPKVHRDVETIILKCLEKDQRRRYPTARAFSEDCQSFLKGEVITARPATIGYRCRRFLTRRPLLNLLAFLVICLSLAMWFGIDTLRALVREKEETRQVLEIERAEKEKIAQAKEKADKEARRDWRTEYTLNFDFYFRFDSDLDASRRQGIPWLNPLNAKDLTSQTPRVQILADPPRWALTDPHAAGSESESSLANSVVLGLPFTFPREVRLALRIATPPQNVGELVLSIDVDKDYAAHLGTTTVRFGSPTHPGVFFYRSGMIIGEDAAFFLKPGTTMELVLERSDDRLRAFVDGRQILEADDPSPVFNADPGRVTLGVKNGTLEFMDLAVDLRSLSKNLASSLIDIANDMAAQGRAELAVRLYVNVLLEPTDDHTHLRALRGYARSLWLGLPRRERNPAGIEKACNDLWRQLTATGRSLPGQIEFIKGLALASSQSDGGFALDQLRIAATTAYDSGNRASVEYGDLAKLEEQYVYLRRGMLGEAARNFLNMLENGSLSRLHERFGSELGGGGQIPLLLEKVDTLIRSGEQLDIAATLLRAAAAISPNSRECANHFRRLGSRYAAQNEYENGIHSLRQAEQIAPDWFRPYLDEARVHFENGQAGQGRDAIARALRALPQSLDLHLGIARLYLEELPPELQDAARAGDAAHTATLLSNSGNPLSLELLALALLRQERFYEAGKAIDAAIAIEENAKRTAIRNDIHAKYGPSPTNGQ